MDVTRLKKAIAGISASAIMLTQVGTAFAAYADVPSGAWYEEAVEAFLDAGFLDSTKTSFRGMDGANRAEFVKLLVELNGGVLSTPPAVGSFTDVKSSAWYYSYFEEAGKEGWVRGDGDCYGSLPCNARPSALVNRAEAAALIVRAFALDWNGDAPQFVDNPSGQWYTDAIQTAADHCVLQGDDSTGRVRPADTMNRAEMVVMLHRVDQNLMYGVDCGAATQASIHSAVALDLRTIEVDFSTDVDQASAEMMANYQVTAGGTAQTITGVKLVGDHTVEITVASDLDSTVTYTVAVEDIETAAGKTFSDTATFVGFSATPKGDGELEVSVASNSPMGDTVPRGANGVTMLSLDLTASCEDDVVVNDLTLLHEGFGSPSDLEGVYAAVNGERVTRKRTIDSKAQTATIHFTSPWTITKCQTGTLDLMADFSTTATTSGEHSIVVELPSDFDSNAKEVTGTFPLKGKTFRVGAVTSGILTVDARSATPNRVKVGDKEVVVGKFEFSANSTEDQTLYSVTLQQSGTAKDGDITNIKVRSADKTVLTNTVASMKGDFVTLVFNPPRVFKSSDRATLEIVADVESGANDTVILEFEESSDIFAVGSLYGYGVNGQLYGSQVSLGTTASTTITIDAGRFTLAIAGPAQQTFTNDEDAANLANVKMTAGGTETLNVKHMFLAIEGATSTGRGFGSATAIQDVIENVVLKNAATGRSYTGVRITTSGASGTGASTGGHSFQIYRFDDFSIKGEQTFQLLVDFIDNGATAHPLNGDTFTVSICGEPTRVSGAANATGCVFGGLVAGANTTDLAKSFQLEVEGLSSADPVEDVRPRGIITGQAQRIATANLTITQEGTGASENAVRNVKNLNLLRFQAKAGEAKDILLTQAVFCTDTSGCGAAGSGSANNGTNYTLWVDTNSDGTVDTIVQSGVAPVDGAVTFDDLTGGGYVIPKEKTVVFEVHGDIASSLTTTSCSTGECLRLAFATNTSTRIEAQDVVRGSSLSSSEITVTTATSKHFTLVNQGDLFVNLENTGLRSQQLLGGELTQPVMRLEFESQNEAIDVTTLQISASGSTATSVSRLQLFLEGATSPFAEATGCGSEDTPGNTTFCAQMRNHQLVIPKNSDVDVIVRALMKSDTNGGTSNQTLQFYISPEETMNYSTGSGAVRAFGVDSSNNLAANEGGPTSTGSVYIGRTAVGGENAIVKGPKNVSVLSKIASITNASQYTDGATLPLGSDIDLGAFRFTAAQNTNTLNGSNNVVLSGVILNVSASNVNINPSTLVLYDATSGDTGTTADCAAYRSDMVEITNVASGSFLVHCRSLPTSNLGTRTEITPGSSKAFALRGTPTATTNAVYSLQVSLQNFSNINYESFTNTTSHLTWLDRDSSSTATFLWADVGGISTVGSVIFRN